MVAEEREALEKAMTLIEAQALEIQAHEASIASAMEIQTAMQAEIVDLEAKIETLEKLLHQTDEGLSEALIVLGAMRDGLKRVAEAAELTVGSLSGRSDEGEVSERLKALSEAVSETRDDVLFVAHEEYLRGLRARLGK